MKIEIKDKDWTPITVTIETRKEAEELVLLIQESRHSAALWSELYYMLGDIV